MRLSHCPFYFICAWEFGAEKLNPELNLTNEIWGSSERKNE